MAFKDPFGGQYKAFKGPFKGRYNELGGPTESAVRKCAAMVGAHDFSPRTGTKCAIGTLRFSTHMRPIKIFISSAIMRSLKYRLLKIH